MQRQTVQSIRSKKFKTLKSRKYCVFLERDWDAQSQLQTVAQVCLKNGRSPSLWEVAVLAATDLSTALLSKARACLMLAR